MNYPDSTLVGMLQEDAMLDLLLRSYEHGIGKSPTPEMLALKDECAQAVAGDPAEALLNLERDYTRLFFASKPRLAYLFESVYREGRLLQESTFQVARRYRDAGLTLSEDFRLPLDHIAVELEFLSFLLLKQAESVKHQDADANAYAQELRNVLLEEHLSALALALSERVGKHARHPLYRLAAALLAADFAAVPKTEPEPQERNA
jgi:TorA maturation chaperone TorD